MQDGFRDYDRWKLMSPEDEADEREQQRLRAERDADRADEMRDREMDEARHHMRHDAEPSSRSGLHFTHGGE
jgi:hypothetical protein